MLNLKTRTQRYLMLAPLLAVTFTIAACSESNTTNATAVGPTTPKNYEETLRTAMETAKPGDVISIPAGTHQISRSFTLNTDKVTIKGAGMDKTILSFKNQIAGAEGIVVNASDFTIEDLAIEDTKGDGLKVNEGKNIIIRRIRTEWTNGPDTSNGSYGVYPVQTENVLIEETVAIGASDAGIYVGQSKHVVVRNNRAEYNVAGIEIENTIDADVYNNTATNNTGGILVFNMADLPITGEQTRVHDNVVSNNNTDNFGPAGTAVSYVPSGTGVMISSNDKVEIFSNEIANNKTANILIASTVSSSYETSRETAANFDPYPEGIFIYANNFSGGGNAPDHPGMAEFLKNMQAQSGDSASLPDIVWDGATNPSTKPEADQIICVDNQNASFVNLDINNNFTNMSLELGAHACTMPKLAATQLDL